MKFEILPLAMTSLLLACKASELDDNLPFLSDMIDFAHKSNFLDAKMTETLNLKDHLEIERILLNKLEWNPLQLTPYDFIEHLFSAGIFFEDDQMQEYLQKKKLSNLRRGSKNLNKLVKVVSRISILTPEIRRFSSSVIACSCIRTSRQLLGL